MALRRIGVRPGACVCCRLCAAWRRSAAHRSAQFHFSPKGQYSHGPAVWRNRELGFAGRAGSTTEVVSKPVLALRHDLPVGHDVQIHDAGQLVLGVSRPPRSVRPRR